MRILLIAALSFIMLTQASGSKALDLPYREFYPEVEVIELADLKSGYDKGDYLIVDVRAAAEYEAIHVKGAVNIQYSNSNFLNKLRNLASANPDKKIAVYCNGIVCIKCYKAAEDAMYEQIPQVYAFDVGILAWAKAYPADTVLNGKEIENPEQQLISESSFNQSCIDFDTFKKKAEAGNAVVIDARDPIQRKNKLPGLEKTLNIPIDKLVNNIIRKGHMKDKELLIFDQVGKQVNWLMYYLVASDYNNFYFLDGGATAVLKKQEYR